MEVTLSVAFPKQQRVNHGDPQEGKLNPEADFVVAINYVIKKIRFDITFKSAVCPLGVSCS